MASSSAPAEVEDPRPSWAVLNRVALYADKDPGELYLPLAKPPRLSHLIIPSRIDRTYYGGGEHPYIVAANDAGLLIHVSPGPQSGFNLGAADPQSRLVVARHFAPDDGTGLDGQLTATTLRVDAREDGLSPFSGVTSVGLLPVSDPAGFVVAELQVVEDQPGQRLAINLIWFRFTAMKQSEWRELQLTCPSFTPGANAAWTPHDVVAFDGKLWWVDLSRGILFCNPVDPNPDKLMPDVIFVALPDLAGEMFVAPQDRQEGLPQIDSRRIVRVSGSKLRFVDVVQRQGDPPEATRVVVWTLESEYDREIGRARWEHHQCLTTLGTIWGHDSYVASGMPWQLPELAFLHPEKHSVVYFFLDAYLFSVDVKESAVVEYAGEPRRDVVEVPGGPQRINWRYVLTWVAPRFKMGNVSSITATAALATQDSDSEDNEDVS